MDKHVNKSAKGKLSTDVMLGTHNGEERLSKSGIPDVCSHARHLLTATPT